jgi:hypothetical protein
MDTADVISHNINAPQTSQWLSRVSVVVFLEKFLMGASLKRLA